MAVPQQTTIQQAVGQPMAQEIPPVAPQAQPLATTGPMDPQSAIKALTGGSIAIDFGMTDIIQRIQMYQSWPGRGLFNTPLLETFLTCDAPKGVSVVLMATVPTINDCWHGKDAVKIMGQGKADDGYVMPTANFIKKIAGLMGVKLIKHPPKVVNDTGRAQYEELYDAYIILPNGTVEGVFGEGKAQNLTNTDGSPVAGLRESTRKKGKRNAFREALGMDLLMKKEEFLRPWILTKLVVKPGQSEEADAIIDFQKRLADDALKMLYGKGSSQVEAKPGVDELVAAASEAPTLDDLRMVRDRGRAAGLTQDQYIIFKHAVETRLTELQGGAQGANPA